MIDIDRLIEQLDADEDLTDSERREIYWDAVEQNKYEVEQDRWNVNEEEE